ncbi:MAG: hypothetical protein HOP31_13830 [Ignavibacteria bacterium]|nr:hypothetical protein [Ignavibacteria bacterium]
MKQEILDNIQNPSSLERLFRKSQTEFTESFNELYPEINLLPIAQFWKVRLEEDSDGKVTEIIPGVNESIAGSKNFKLIFTILAAFICGTVIKIPQIFGLDMQKFLIDNLPFVLFPALSIYYLLKFKAESRKYLIIFSIVLAAVLFMNLIPWQDSSQTRILSALHFSFITWILLGASYVSFDLSSRTGRMLFLKRNGDMLILMGVIICCGMLLIMLSVAMFSVIEVKLDKVLENYVVIYGLVSAPLIANYMIESSPKIISRVAPFISKIFTPLMLIAMTGFLTALIFFAKDPFNNREELIVFNVLLAAIIGVLIFSFSGNSENHRSVYNKILLLLSMEAMIINSIAVSAIVYRLFSFGVSPNRIAVLGANLLLFANLILITIKLIQFIRNKAAAENVESGMTVMLPYYAVWAVIIAVLMPMFFWFR